MVKLRFNIDPPAYKIIAGAVAIFLTDVGEALAAIPPSEALSRLQIARIVIHAGALAFMFLSAGEKPQGGET